MEQCDGCQQPIRDAAASVTVHGSGEPLVYHPECVPWRGQHHYFRGKEWSIEGRVAAALARRLELIGGTVTVSAEELQQPPTGMIFHPMAGGGIAVEIQQ